jgi:very-short-patch-repair endonuclease
VAREPNRAGFDAAIAALARTQQGNIARRQLLDLGLTYRGIAWRVERKRLHKSFPSVFGVGNPPTSMLSWAWAAVLAGGPDAVLSHESAGVLWKMVERWQRPFHVTASTDRRIHGIKVHRAQTLTPADITVQEGIPITTPARTALDLAPGRTTAALTRAVNDSRHAGYLHPAALNELLDRSAGQRGVKALRELAAEAAVQAPTQSQFEDDFLAFAKRYRLPTPLVNVKVAGHLVDAYFPEHKLVIELDGWEFHNDRAAFNNDRNRDADLLAIDHGTVRITWERLKYKPDREAARLKTILKKRAALR